MNIGLQPVWCGSVLLPKVMRCRYPELKVRLRRFARLGERKNLAEDREVTPDHILCARMHVSWLSVTRHHANQNTYVLAATQGRFFVSDGVRTRAHNRESSGSQVASSDAARHGRRSPRTWPGVPGGQNTK